MSLLRVYEPATRCVDGPAPGAKALMAWFLAYYGRQGGKNLGIYDCRTVRGGSTKSLHGEGRALDFGVNPHGASWGTGLAELLRARSGELGVQCVIWNRRIWSGAYPDAGWRAYAGTNPHVDHIHLELTRSAASLLTPQRVHDVLVARNQAPHPAVAQAKASRSPKGDAMLIKSQPDKSKPEYVAALLTGFNFVGLGRTETPTDEQAAQMGLPVLWVEYGTYQEFDRRSHVMLGDRPSDAPMRPPAPTP
jgi:hypothetical protein